MKSMKKILSALLALIMVLSMGSFALANDGEGGVETEYLWEPFESPAISETTLIAPGETFNGWARQKASTGTGFKYEIAAEGTNQFLQYYHTGSDIAAYRTFSKAFEKSIKVGETIRISFKMKKDSTYNGMFGITLGKAEFLFRTAANYLYPGNYSNSPNTAVAAIPSGKWNDIELLIENGETEGKYQFYLNGSKVTAGIPAQGGVNSGKTDLALGEVSSFSMRSWANSDAGTANAKLYFDDIKVTTVDEKKICEIAAEKISVPSSATGNITLPASGFAGTTISWKSSDTSLISNGGAVTRPESGEIQPVTLTATVTYGETSVSFPYTVKVLPASVYYYEDFEGAKIGSLTNYDNWRESHSSGSAYDEVFESNIAWQSVTNKAMELKRAKLPDTGTSGSSMYTISKSLANAPSNGTISVRMNLYYDNFVWPCVTLSDGSKSQSFMFRTNWSTIYNPSSSSNYVQPVQMIAGKNHDIEFRVDTAENEIELIFNGRSVLTTSTEITTVSSISFYENRTGLNGSESTNEIFYIDNIVAELIDVPFEYSTIDFTFKDAEGNPTLYPEEGGVVSEVIVKKHKSADDSVLIVAAYDGTTLTKATTPIDISNALLNSETAYGVNLPIASENTKIRAFILAKDSVAPLALDKVYEKRSPITLFVAGDSMAENVSGSTSSKEVNGETVTYAREGWGMRIGAQFINESVTVSNHAVGGRDTAEFISEGRLRSILANGERGDFVLVSFGHNDQGSNMSIDTYKENLKAYSKAIKEKGMTPIFITPVTRISTSAEDTDTLTPDANLKLYADAMIAAAGETGDVCLDLYTAYNNFLNGKKYSEIREYFVPKNIDGTHFSPAGAQKAAELIAELLSESASTLKDILN